MAFTSSTFTHKNHHRTGRPLIWSSLILAVFLAGCNPDARDPGANTPVSSGIATSNVNIDNLTMGQQLKLIESVDPAEVLELANAGDPTMQYIYGWMLVRGISLQKDIHRGVAFIHKAAEGGFGEAHFTIGNLYERGQAGYAKDIGKAIAWYEKGVASGNIKSMVNLA